MELNIAYCGKVIVYSGSAPLIVGQAATKLSLVEKTNKALRKSGEIVLSSRVTKGTDASYEKLAPWELHFIGQRLKDKGVEVKVVSN